MLENPFSELGIKNEVVEAAITTMCKESLKDSGLDNKSIMRTKNMFALGLVCWLFHRDISVGEKLLREKFAKKPEIAEANVKVLYDGYHFGENTHASVAMSYMVPSKEQKVKGRYMDINGNKATAYGLIAAAEKQACSFIWVHTLLLRLPISCTNWQSINHWVLRPFSVKMKLPDVLRP